MQYWLRIEKFFHFFPCRLILDSDYRIILVTASWYFWDIVQGSEFQAGCFRNISSLIVSIRPIGRRRSRLSCTLVSVSGKDSLFLRIIFCFREGFRFRERVLLSCRLMHISGESFSKGKGFLITHGYFPAARLCTADSLRQNVLL